MAAVLGMRCRLVQEEWTRWDDPVYDKVGHILLSRLMGAETLLEGEGYSRHRPGLQHLAFMVKSRAAVHTVYARVQELGSPVIHPPQEFPQYHPGYYVMFWQDPEGFMLEVVCHRDRG